MYKILEKRQLSNDVFYKDGYEENIIENLEDTNIQEPQYIFTSLSNNFTPPQIFEGIDFSNAVTKVFSDKTGEVLNNFDKNNRLVVQIKSKNFFIFSYVKTVVRIDHKKRFWFGWRTLQNYDELRAGFVNLVLDFDLPDLNDPLINKGQSSNIIDQGVNTYLKSIGNVKFDNDFFDLYRLDDLLKIKNLPFGLRGEISNFLENPESFYSDILNNQKNQLIIIIF